MIAVLALVPDLLFGSKLQAMLESAGHEVEIAMSESDVWDQIAGSRVLVIDLTTDTVDGVTLVDSLRTGGEMHDVRVLGFYSHVDTPTRVRAEEAGFDMVVPRSRMAREGAKLVERLAAG